MNPNAESNAKTPGRKDAKKILHCLAPLLLCSFALNSAAQTDTNLPNIAPIQGAFGWKLGQKAPAWVPLHSIITNHSTIPEFNHTIEINGHYSYQTKTNAPFDYISIQCLNDRTIYMILASTPDTTNHDNAGATLDDVYQTLFSKYGLPDSQTTNSYRWKSTGNPSRFISETLDGPRFSFDPQIWHVSIDYVDVDLMHRHDAEEVRRDQNNVSPVGNGL
jgi:hypothetical protein